MNEETLARKGDWMTLVSGRQFWPFDPRPGDVRIADIAHSLSMQCRYGGHSPQFYSVAEHSVLLSRRVSPENQLWALMHDSPETYLKDTIRPIKRSFPELTTMEDTIMGVIAKKYGLPPKMPQEVKDEDDEMLREECLFFYGMEVYRTWGIYRDNTKARRGYFRFLSPHEAKEAFLQRFMELI